MYGWRARIGILIPSSNTTMEPEFNEMAPEGVSIHASRMKLVEVTEESLIKMEEYAERAAKLLVDANVDLIVYGCTTGSLVKGAGYDLELSNKLERACGRPVIATATAVLEALREVEAEKVCVATPYIEELNEKEKKFLEDNGFRVLKIKGLGIRKNVEIGKLPPSTAYRLAREVFAPDADCIFISCTNFRTIEVIELLEEDLGVPIITSNQASMWAALKRLGISQTIGGFGALLE